MDGHVQEQGDRSTARRVAIIDVVVVAAVSLLYAVSEAVHLPKRWYFLFAALAAVLYLIYLVRRRVHSWRDLGFRTDNLVEGLAPVGLFTTLAGSGLVLWAAAQGRTAWTPEVAALIALYPAWAVAQQLAFQGLLHRGVMVLLPSRVLQVSVVGAAFALVHVGGPILVGLTFAAGVIWSLLYRRWPNLWLLAASHTVLAALAYPLVLADAPLSRV